MGLEDKSSSYLFWLSEYLARKLLVNIGPNAALLLRFFEIGEMVSTGRIEDLEYQPAPADIAACIYSGAWKAHTPELAQRFSEAFIDSLPGMQEEIDALAAYIPAHEEDIKLALQLGANPLDADTIIHACINERLPDIMAQKYYGAVRAFTDAAVTSTLADGENPSRIRCSNMGVEDGVLHLHNVSIDLTANLDDILADITALVCDGRNEAAFLSLGVEDNHRNPEWSKAMNELWKNGCPGYGPCSGGKCQIDKRYSLNAKVLRKGAEGGYAYTDTSDTARAVGLWIWDYARENACSVGAAARSVREQDFFKRLYDDRKSDRVLERWCACTEKCIGQGRVLAVS